MGCTASIPQCQNNCGRSAVPNTPYCTTCTAQFKQSLQPHIYYNNTATQPQYQYFDQPVQQYINQPPSPRKPYLNQPSKQSQYMIQPTASPPQQQYYQQPQIPQPMYQQPIYQPQPYQNQSTMMTALEVGAGVLGGIFVAEELERIF